MAWTDPFTAVAGQIFTAAQWNQYGRDNLNHLKGVIDGLTFSGCSLTRLAETSIADSTWTAITWTAETVDVGAWYSSGTDVIVPAGAIPSGFTKITAWAPVSSEWLSNATGTRQLRVNVNGTPVRSLKGPSLSGDTTVVTGAIFITDLVAGDVITMEVFQSSTGALNVKNSALGVIRYLPQS